VKICFYFLVLKYRNKKFLFRALTNLLGNLKIRCKFSINGCEEILAIDDLDNHQKSCHFEKCKTCFCINSVDHNCVKSLLESKLKSDELINDLQNKLKLANEKMSSMNSEIDNYLQTIQALSNDDSQEISFKSKTQSLLSSEPRQASQFIEVGQLQQTNLLYPPVQSISRQTIQSQNLGLLPETSFQSDKTVAIKTRLERDEEERLFRKKKLEAIMSRTRKNASTRGNSSNETPEP
jgi:hypothetical protein